MTTATSTIATLAQKAIDEIAWPYGITLAVVSDVCQPNNTVHTVMVVAGQPTRICQVCGQDLPVHTADGLVCLGNHGAVQELDRQHQCGA